MPVPRQAPNDDSDPNKAHEDLESKLMDKIRSEMNAQFRDMMSQMSMMMLKMQQTQQRISSVSPNDASPIQVNNGVHTHNGDVKVDHHIYTTPPKGLPSSNLKSSQDIDDIVSFDISQPATSPLGSKGTPPTVEAVPPLLASNINDAHVVSNVNLAPPATSPVPVGMNTTRASATGTHASGSLLDSSTGVSGPLTSVSTTYSGPKAPVDTDQNLPTLTELSDTSHPEVFIAWKTKLVGNAKAVPKLYGILESNPVQSWELFKSRNGKYTAQQLEHPYLDAHRRLFSYILSALDDKLRTRMDDIMRSPTEVAVNNIPKLLKFTNRDFAFYENASALLDKLEKNFMVKSGFRIGTLIMEFQNLRYHGREDPRTFIATFHELRNKERLLIPNYSPPSEDHVAHLMLAKLPVGCDSIKSQFYTKAATNQPITVDEVESTLTQWWFGSGEKRAKQQERDGRRDAQRKGQPGTTNPPQSAAAAVEGKEGVPNTSHNRQKRERFQQQKSSTNAADKPEGEQMPYEFGNVTVEVPNDFEEPTDAADTVNAATTTYPSNYIPGPNDGLYDTATTTNCTGRKDLLFDIEKIPPTRIITMGGERVVNQEGTLHVSARHKVKFHNVRHIPGAPYTIFSAAGIAKSGCQTLVVDDMAIVLPAKTFKVSDFLPKAVMVFHRKGNLYTINLHRDDDTKRTPDFEVTNRTDRTIPRKGDNPVQYAKPSDRVVAAGNASSTTNHTQPQGGNASTQSVNASTSTTRSQHSQDVHGHSPQRESL